MLRLPLIFLGGPAREKFFRSQAKQKISLPFPLQDGGRHGRLAQGDGAVVGRRQLVGEHLETLFFQQVPQAHQQQGILKDPPGQGHGGNPGLLPHRFTGRGQQMHQGIVEPGRDPGRSHALPVILHHPAEDGQGVQDQGIRLLLEGTRCPGACPVVQSR